MTITSDGLSGTSLAIFVGCSLQLTSNTKNLLIPSSYDKIISSEGPIFSFSSIKLSNFWVVVMSAPVIRKGFKLVNSNSDLLPRCSNGVFIGYFEKEVMDKLGSKASNTSEYESHAYETRMPRLWNSTFRTKYLS